MTNASTTAAKSKRRARIKRVHAARKRVRTTSVMVPMMAWQRPDPLLVKHKGVQQHIKGVLMACGRPAAKPMVLAVHESHCMFGVFIMPMPADIKADDIDEMREVIADRDARCKCCPTIMYTGARA